MAVEGRWLGLQAAEAGSSGLLKHLLRLDALVCGGVSLGLSDGDESFGLCWMMTTTVQIY